MCISLMLAALIGVLIPLIFNMFNIDPAVASGPFITTVVDITTLIVYFTFAIYFIEIISPNMVGFARLGLEGVLA